MGDHDAHLTPGEGAIDWISLFRQLRQWDFHGPLILELADSGESPAQIMARARVARTFLQEIVSRQTSGIP